MKVAKRVEDLPPYLFVEISKKKAAKRAEGVKLADFGIGDPDLPTPDHILNELHSAADDPSNHRYPESEGLPELRSAIAGWMKRRFDLDFDPETEIPFIDLLNDSSATNFKNCSSCSCVSSLIIFHPRCVR